MRGGTSTLLVRAAGALGVLVVVALVLKIGVGIGPNLPGPKVRELVGAVQPFAPCKPNPEQVRRPSQPPTTSVQWRRGARMVRPLANEEVRAAAVGDSVYLGAGVRPIKGGAVFASVRSLFRFDPADGTYQRTPGLPRGLDHTVFTSWKGQLYVFGGFSDREPSARAWRYSPATREWTELAPMRHARGGLGGAVIGDRFYAVGGHISPGPDIRVFDTLEIYDFRANRWSEGPPMPTARHHVPAVAVKGKLYVIGGRGDRDLSLRAFERFDPASGTWERLPPLPQGVGDPAAVAARGQVVVMGGGDDDEKWVTPATWAFDPSSRRWRRLSDLAVARHGFAATVARNRILVFGGAPCAGYGRTGATESLDLRALSERH